jgi:hypothetical protein
MIFLLPPLNNVTTTLLAYHESGMGKLSVVFKLFGLLSFWLLWLSWEGGSTFDTIYIGYFICWDVPAFCFYCGVCYHIT